MIKEEKWQKPQTKALWYSRYEPTPEQLEDMKATNRQLIQLDELKEAAMMTLQNDSHVEAIVCRLKKLIKEYNIQEVYGFFPIPFVPYLTLSHESLLKMHNNEIEPVPCFSAWYIKNEQDSTFFHYQWVAVGYLQ